MAFWLDRGVAGFRIDMAFSLVKDDSGKNGGAEATTALWREIRDWLDATYPDAVIVPEGKEPRTGAPLAFHADFFLVIHEEHASLFDNHFAGMLPFQAPREPFFDAAGGGSTRVFLDSWNVAKEVDPARPIIMSTADHDFDRLCCGPRTGEQLGSALTFLFTWGSVPCLYYGDEIGMRYLPDMPDVEGAICNPAYNRAGCRTPMQWDDGPNAGFSTADRVTALPPGRSRPGAPHRRRAGSTILGPPSTSSGDSSPCARRRPRSARGQASRVLHDGYPFAYVRGETHLVVVNPRREPATFHAGHLTDTTALLADGVAITDGTVHADGFGYGIFALSGG